MVAKWCMLMLLFVAFLSVSNSLEWGDHVYSHLHRVQTDKIQRIVLDPVKDSAIMLYRVRPFKSDAIDVDFAYNLSVVVDTFEQLQVTHEWYDSLMSTLCKEFQLVSASLRATCDNSLETLQSLSQKSDRPQQPPHHTLCWCGTFSTIMHTCHHHVVPWATDISPNTCSQVITRCGQEGDIHPLQGLCVYKLHKEKPHRVRHRPPGFSMPHTTAKSSPKFRSWRHLKVHRKKSQIAEFVSTRINLGQK